jgi:hypothetical protein
VPLSQVKKTKTSQNLVPRTAGSYGKWQGGGDDDAESVATGVISAYFRLETSCPSSALHIAHRALRQHGLDRSSITRFLPGNLTISRLGLGGGYSRLYPSFCWIGGIPMQVHRPQGTYLMVSLGLLGGGSSPVVRIQPSSVPRWLPTGRSRTRRLHVSPLLGPRHGDASLARSRLVAGGDTLLLP